MKRVEFMEWNTVKERAISGKLLAIVQEDNKKAGNDDGTIMMYMGEEDPEAAQGIGFAESRARDACENGSGEIETLNSR